MDSIEKAIDKMATHYTNIYEADEFTLKLICAENAIGL